MRVVLTIPDSVKAAQITVRDRDGAITSSEIIHDGELTESRFINKAEVIGMRYTEGLEKRIDALEAELREEVARKFGVVHETFVALDKKVERIDVLEAHVNKSFDAFNARMREVDDALCRLSEQVNIQAKSIVSASTDMDDMIDDVREDMDRLEKRIEDLGKTVDSLDKWTDATDGQLRSIEGRLANLERARLASETVQFEKGKDFKDAPRFIFNGEEKPCVIAEGLDAEALKKALNDPKMKTIPDGALENRGPYTDILRRLGALEKRANVARADITKIMGHKVTLEERVDKLEERAKTSRPTWEYFNKLVERIEGLEGRVEPIESLLDKGEDGAYPFLPTVKDYAEIKKKIDALEEAVKKASCNGYCYATVYDDVEDLKKQAAIAESVRKQLAKDIKTIQGRINKICEETCVDA